MSSQEEMQTSDNEAPTSSPISDEVLTQFLTWTGTDDPSRASYYLEMSSGNLETAVSLFMEHSHSAAPTSSATSNSTACTPAPAPATATDPDEVRPPDQVRTMRLMDFDDHPSHLPVLNSNMLGGEEVLSSFFPGAEVDRSTTNPFFDARETVNAASAAAAAAAASESSSQKTDDDDEDEEPRSSIQTRTLSDMFAPPTHLIHRAGGFQGARAVARDVRRWLLVNLQRDSDFACHALNRDVWRDELVENLVTEGFIFWQQMDNTSDGSTYAQRYNVEAYPHIGILDPRTGRLMWRKEGWTQVNPLTAEEFAQIAADFCSHHTFDKPPTAPRPTTGATTTTTTNTPTTATNTTTKPAPRPKRPIHELSEEQQLQAAIRASMADMNSDSDSAGGEMEESDHEEIQEEDETPEKTFEDELLEVNVGEEPSSGGARVQIRMPDGGRVVRRFDEEDLVKIIYAFVAQSNEEARSGKSFELRAGFPPRDLLPSIDDTIKSSSLSGESITVRWK